MNPTVLFAILLALVLVSCGAPGSQSEDTSSVAATQPPPLPPDAESEDFGATAKHTRQETNTETQDSGPPKAGYWGVGAGEPLPIQWEDLMPEGAMEELERQQEEFYAMLEKRYAANATSLADIDPYASITEGSDLDYMPQLGSFDVVEELDGEIIRLPGYVVPFDFDTKSRHSEFLFVPYMGACIHTPPPPPNQIIYVQADPEQRVEDIWAPYWLEGILSTEKNENELGDAAYTLDLFKLEPYTF